MECKKSVEIIRVKRDIITREEDEIILEYPFTIFLNDQEIVTLLCTPNSLKYLAIGFLFSDGFIDSVSSIERIQIDEEKGLAYVYVKERKKFNEKLQGKRTITTGCGKGTVFYNVLDSFKSKPIDNPLTVNKETITKLIREFNHKSELYLTTGGVHSCALTDVNGIIYFEEDVGRHNALDKILGRAYVEELDLSDKIVLSSGRISSEMLLKVARRGISVIVSRSAATSLSVEIANQLNITLIGFARGEKMNIYTNFPSFSF